MPTFEFTFTDTSTIQVNAPDAAGATEHVNTLLTLAKHTDQNADLKGKALAGTTPRVVDKSKEREAANKAARAP